MSSRNDWANLMQTRPLPFFMQSESPGSVATDAPLPYQTQSEAQPYEEAANAATSLMDNLVDEVSGVAEQKRRLQAALAKMQALRESGTIENPIPPEVDLRNRTKAFGGAIYDKLLAPGIEGMERVGGAMLGDKTYPPVDEINTAATIRMKQAQDVLDAVGLYAGPTIAAGSLGKPSTRTLSALGAKGGEEAAPKTAPIWRSQMQTVLETKLPGKADAPQMAQTIEAFAKKGEFKAEELEWSGVREWLAGKQGKVTKQEVTDYLAENNVKVDEVVKGVKVDPEDTPEIKALRQKIADLEQERSTYPDVIERNRDQHKAVDDIDRYQQELDEKIEYLQRRDEKDTGTVYGTYQLPGGENYRELLLTLPENPKGIKSDLGKPGEWEVFNSRGEFQYRVSSESGAHRGVEAINNNPNNNPADLPYVARPTRQWKDLEVPFNSTHYQEPNILAHVRFNDRVDADGKKVLFIEEIQSDWAQKIRKEGVKSKPEIKEIEVDGKKVYQVIDREGTLFSEESTRQSAEQVAKNVNNRLVGPPDAPFVKDTGKWSMLGMKRMVRYAADNGYDRIAWTTGEQQAARYDLSKHISEVAYSGSNFKAWDLKGNEVITRTGVSPKDLPDLIGKEAAEKLMAQEPKGTLRTLEGQDLKVGGEGMKGFYDKILPSEVNKFFNKGAWGNAKVGQTEIPIMPTVTKQQLKIPGAMAENTPVHSLDITPQMKAKATGEGMPFFSIAGTGAGLGAYQNNKE